ncbi:MAG TPA: hypothetical protein VJ964_02445 [Balneolaceae bacterium]|nr:hypothetical protein [Balneolaceae bacterium]
MLIKSPMRKEKVKPNRRNKSAGKKKDRTKKSFRSNGGGTYGKRIQADKEKKKKLSLPQIKPWKVIVGAIVIGALGVLYLNHVFATQKLLQDVQKMQRKYNQAKRMHNDYKLTYDQMIGPSEIYQKAKEHGFVNGGPAEKVIEVQK